MRSWGVPVSLIIMGILFLFPLIVPSSAIATEIIPNKINDIQIGNDGILLANLSTTQGVLFLPVNSTIDEFLVHIPWGEYPQPHWVRVSGYLVAPNWTETGYFDYFTTINTNGTTNFTMKTAYWNTWTLNDTMFDFNKTFTLNQIGQYSVRFEFETFFDTMGPPYDGWHINDIWVEYIRTYVPPTLYAVPLDTYNIGQNIIYVSWLLIVFLPAVLINSVIPKIGFIVGMVIMSIALTLANTMPIWVFIVSMMGVILIMFRGDDG